MKKIVILCMLMLSIFGCSKGDDYLIMGTNATFPPFEYLGGRDGTSVVGFDVAIGEAIAKSLGKKLKIEDMDFDALVPALMSGKIDFAISGMTITDERKKNVDFSEAYYEAAQMVLIRKDDLSFLNITTKEDLGAQKKLGAQLGTTGSLVATDIAGDNPVTDLKSYELVVMELKNKKIDAIVIDREPAKAFMSKNDDIIELPMDFDAEYYGVAVKKGSTDLLNSINETIKNLVKTGEYQKYIEQHIQNYSAQ